jgi:hypothetical protein
MIWQFSVADPYPKKQWDKFETYLDAAGEFAESSLEKSKLSFWRGLMLFNKAAALGQPTKAAPARSALTVWQKTLSALREGETYGRSNPQYGYSQMVEYANKTIDYLQKVIKVGN